VHWYVNSLYSALLCTEHGQTEDSPKSVQEHEEGLAAETPSEPSTKPEPESASKGEKDDASEEPNSGPEVEAEAEDSKKDASADAQSEPEKPAVSFCCHVREAVGLRRLLIG